MYGTGTGLKGWGGLTSQGWEKGTSYRDHTLVTVSLGEGAKNDTKEREMGCRGYGLSTGALNCVKGTETGHRCQGRSSGDKDGYEA